MRGKSLSYDHSKKCRKNDMEVETGIVTIKFQSEVPSFKENLYQVSAVSLLMTFSTALANVGPFELTRTPLFI